MVNLLRPPPPTTATSVQQVNQLVEVGVFFWFILANPLPDDQQDVNQSQETGTQKAALSSDWLRDPEGKVVFIDLYIVYPSPLPVFFLAYMSNN